MQLPKLLLIGQICLVQSLSSLCSQAVKVDRLISRRHQLQSRDIGYANGGRGSSGGHGGGGEDNRNSEISFYHINDVHA